jgi:diaminopimelate epimerase
MTIRFTKMQAAGNDFIVCDGQITRDWGTLAQKMCDRHFGIGADGVILLLPSGEADARMIIYNADGSEAEACGNGLRCFVRHIVENGVVDAGVDNVTVATKAGIRQAKLHREAGKLAAIEVSMGKPQFGAAEIPVKPDGDYDKLDIILDYPLSVGGEVLKLTFVAMGNPHAVLFSDRPVGEYPLERLGTLVENHPVFPNRTNFEVVRVTGENIIEQRTWERGVGETLACGSGACAVAVAANRHGYVGETVTVNLRGGTVVVNWHAGEEVYLKGKAANVFVGEWPERG